ncbi:efflux RND transporter periplasmic adaptor subunit [Salinisphaera sp. Q1T1-3]|uniref:efflux RND transporter periplasmic adaptor subunit n=1 Tax=Salinisphaera sp. Q1T1-3 TaxID=2321229 RepID=UPI001314D0C6|nr:efflux RND transporter periplasmic adaptor subunit [Salinisphaera sp. Q1T1-3]
MRHTAVRLSGLLVVALFWLSGAEAAAPVGVTEAEKRPWTQRLSLHGTLTSPRDAEITPRVAGLVAAVDIEAGDRVAAGDTLVTLDQRLDTLTLETRLAERRAARARLAEVRRLAAEARQLARENAIADTELAARQAEVEARAAEVARLSAAIARQRETVDRHRVIAPFAGVVRERRVEPGEYAATSTVIAGLVATDRLRADIAAPQAYFGLITPGMPVTIELAAAAGGQRRTTVDVVVPAAGATARSFLVRSFIDNADGRLTPGMSIRGVFSLATPEPVVQVPRDALVRVPGGGVRVWTATVGDDGTQRAIQRQVTIGRSADGRVEVARGLAAGDIVIVRGNETLSQGQAVEIVERLPMTAAPQANDAAAMLPPARAGPRLAVSGAHGLSAR